MMRCELTGTPENQIDPPDFGDATDDDIQAEKEKLADAIYAGAPWDENFEGYRQDLAVNLEAIAFQYYNGKIERDEVAGLVNDALTDAVTAYCEFKRGS